MTTQSQSTSNGVTLDHTSWYVRFLEWAWGTSYTEWNNLCPLFWAVVGTLLLSPFVVTFHLVINILSHIHIRIDIPKSLVHFVSLVAESVFIWLYSVVLSIFCVLVTGAIITHDTTVLITLGVIVLVSISFVGIIAACIYYFDCCYSGEYGATEKVSFRISKAASWPLRKFGSFVAFVCKFIHAKYKKMCPMISWK